VTANFLYPLPDDAELRAGEKVFSEEASLALASAVHFAGGKRLSQPKGNLCSGNRNPLCR